MPPDTTLALAFPCSFCDPHFFLPCSANSPSTCDSNPPYIFIFKCKVHSSPTSHFMPTIYDSSIVLHLLGPTRSPSNSDRLRELTHSNSLTPPSRHCVDCQGFLSLHFSGFQFSKWFVWLNLWLRHIQRHCYIELAALLVHRRAVFWEAIPVSDCDPNFGFEIIIHLQIWQQRQWLWTLPPRANAHESAESTPSCGLDDSGKGGQVHHSSMVSVGIGLYDHKANHYLCQWRDVGSSKIVRFLRLDGPSHWKGLDEPSKHCKPSKKFN